MYEVQMIHVASGKLKTYEYESPYLMQKFMRKMASMIKKGYYTLVYYGEK